MAGVFYTTLCATGPHRLAGAEHGERARLNGRRGLFVAAEGVPFLLGTAIVAVAAWLFCGVYCALLPLGLLVFLYLLFRDPWRAVSPSALGVVSPVDGKVVALGSADDDRAEGAVVTIVIRVSSFGAYTARSPVEGKIVDLRATADTRSPADEAAGLSLLTDENQNVVLRFRGNRFGIPPRAFLSYGDRVGQGQRCANLRLTKFAELELPPGSRVLVTEGQRVAAARDLLAKLPQD
jgi:phosphatidylserine decarboxylase